MLDRPPSGVLDEPLLRAAAEQFGVVSVEQLRCRHNRSPASIYRARRAGLLVDVAPGVVRLASSPDSFHARCMAAQLRIGEAGVLSGWTAGRLFGLRGMPRRPIHVTTGRSFRRHLPDWAEVHLSTWYDRERDRHIGPGDFAVATPLRTLWALAAAFNQHRFERAAEDAWHLRLVTPAEALNYLEQHRCRGKDGVAVLERWLEGALARPLATQSDLERRLIAALERTALPAPARQHPVLLPDGDTIHLDIAWPAIRLGVEPGASWWHGGDLAMRRDQARDRACVEVGWQIVRFDESMREDLGTSVAQIVRIHRSRSRELEIATESRAQRDDPGQFR